MTDMDILLILAAALALCFIVFITVALNKVQTLRWHLEDCQARLAASQKQYQSLLEERNDLDEGFRALNGYIKLALQQVTPKANATVRRMARMLNGETR